VWPSMQYALLCLVLPSTRVQHYARSASCTGALAPGTVAASAATRAVKVLLHLCCCQWCQLLLLLLLPVMVVMYAASAAVAPLHEAPTSLCGPKALAHHPPCLSLLAIKWLSTG
jgi:hypothetical protein